MLLVSPLAAAMMSASFGPDEPKPMFSPARVHWTPWALNRGPMLCSPEHWCSRPQPLIISWLCSADALESLASRVSAGRPASARASLMSAMRPAFEPQLPVLLHQDPL